MNLSAEFSDTGLLAQDDRVCPSAGREARQLSRALQCTVFPVQDVL